MENYVEIPSPIIKGKAGKEVMYPVSYEYNGGIIVDKSWYKGYKVGKPIVPKGLKLVGMGVGLNLNCCPPLATARLMKI